MGKSLLECIITKIEITERGPNHKASVKIELYSETTQYEASELIKIMNAQNPLKHDQVYCDIRGLKTTLIFFDKKSHNRNKNRKTITTLIPSAAARSKKNK